jgi:hypothetical protein
MGKGAVSGKSLKPGDAQHCPNSDDSQLNVYMKAKRRTNERRKSARFCGGICDMHKLPKVSLSPHPQLIVKTLS